MTDLPSHPEKNFGLQIWHPWKKLESRHPPPPHPEKNFGLQIWHPWKSWSPDPPLPPPWEMGEPLWAPTGGASFNIRARPVADSGCPRKERWPHRWKLDSGRRPWLPPWINYWSTLPLPHWYFSAGQTVLIIHKHCENYVMQMPIPQSSYELRQSCVKDCLHVAFFSPLFWQKITQCFKEHNGFQTHSVRFSYHHHILNANRKTLRY